MDAGPGLRAKFSRSPRIASRNRLQRILATYAAMSPWRGGKRGLGPVLCLQDRGYVGASCNPELPRIPLLGTSVNKLIHTFDYLIVTATNSKNHSFE